MCQKYHFATNERANCPSITAFSTSSDSHHHAMLITSRDAKLWKRKPRQRLLIAFGGRMLQTDPDNQQRKPRFRHFAEGRRNARIAVEWCSPMRDEREHS
jgi:hypothetical protein